ncbi:hypothetical protein C9F04_22400, partial [Salmonella enterica subsp. enterica serovar Wilhelmsburg]
LQNPPPPSSTPIKPAAAPELYKRQVREAMLRVLPVFRRGFQSLIDYAAVFFLGDQLAKGVFPFRRPMFAAGVGQTVKREAVNAFFL